ncbi:MAG TPA: DUF1598 domain-containing protein [Pirellulaceae bacterium]|nr:DUF1598 domain-containing protein [Pirellulaceae bacterium]
MTRLVSRGIAGIALLLAMVPLASAQQNNQNNGGGGGGPGAAGVVVNASGVLSVRQFGDPGNLLNKRWAADAKARLPGDLAKSSELRKVSLNRLEAAIADKLDKGEPITDEIKYLAGITRLQYVFYYPETKDIVIAGPAEAFAPDASGRVIGVDSGRAVLELQDLVVALRAYPPGGDPTKELGVSIDPTKEGLQRMREFLARISGSVRPGDAGRIVEGLKETLGLQTVSVRGISPQTHFAQVMVEADYRMKLIGIGIEKPPIKLASYVDKASPTDISRNALTRWFFTPNYDCVRVTEDNLAMELVGEGVKLIGENELVQADGTRAATGNGNRASELFCQGFTANYSKLSQKVAVYAQLRNLIDMSIAAAYIQQQDYYGSADWRMELFGDENRFAVEVYETPKQVETACTAVWKGTRLVTPVGGGVSVNPLKAISSENRQKEQGEVTKARQQVKLDNLAKGQWWWD